MRSADRGTGPSRSSSSGSASTSSTRAAPSARESRGAGEVDLEGRASADRRLDDHAAVVLARDAVDRRQAEAVALAGGLRREEGLEDPAEDLGLDPRAVVAD